MALISGLGTTYNLPNYHGQLFNISPQDTPFTTAIGGLGLAGGGGGSPRGSRTTSTTYEWQSEDLRAASATRQRLEGADAPGFEERTRVNITNVVEIHQEAVAVSYTKQAAVANYNGLNVGGPLNADNPVVGEFAHQMGLQVAAKKRDIEATFILGTKNIPTDNTTARRTGGILEAIQTNVIAKTGAPNPTRNDFIDTMQMAYDNGGITEEESRILMVPPALKRWVTKLFISDANYQQESANIGGVRCTQVLTDFGVLNVMVNRYMPAGTAAIVSLEDVEPVFLEIPGKGVFFVEALAKTGAQEKAQLYGEVGLKWGNERKHAKITGFVTTAPTS